MPIYKEGNSVNIIHINETNISAEHIKLMFAKLTGKLKTMQMTNTEINTRIAVAKNLIDEMKTLIAKVEKAKTEREAYKIAKENKEFIKYLKMKNISIGLIAAAGIMSTTGDGASGYNTGISVWNANVIANSVYGSTTKQLVKFIIADNYDAIDYLNERRAKYKKKFDKKIKNESTIFNDIELI